MSLPIPPSITKGQLALDPINGIVYYKDDNNNTVATTWSWLQNLNDETKINSDKNVSIDQDLTIGGDLIIGGDTVSLNVSQVLIEDNILVLNYNFTGSPILDAGLEIERGIESNVSIKWNELLNKWQFTNDGTTYLDLNSIIEDSVTLGLHTVGDYVKSITAGAGILVSQTSGESATPTISISGTKTVFNTALTDDDFAYVGTTNSFTANQSITGTLTTRAASTQDGIILQGRSGGTSSYGVSLIPATLSASRTLTLPNVSGTVVTTGDTGTITSTMILDGTIVNTDVSSSAAIALSKLASGTSGQVIIANGSGVPTYVTISGDITISSTGVATIAANSVALGTDTTGNYVQSVTGGTGVTVTGTAGEGWTPTISIGQAVGTTATVTFNTVNANLVGNVTGTVSDLSNHSIDDLSDVTISGAANGDFLRYNGSVWINDPVNLTTDTVGDYVAKLAAGTGITITNNSGEGATPNISFSGTIDDVSDVVITSATNGQTLIYNGTNWVNTTFPSTEPIGHENKSDSVISFNETTREFSISPVSTSYTVWCSGKRYVKTSTEKVTIPNTPGLYYIYFNTSGALAYKTTFFTFNQDTPTSYVYWNSDDSKAYFFADERHGVTLDWATHEYLHRTRGAAIASGFGASSYTLTGDGSLDAHAKIDIANGTFFDEDLQVDITHSASPTANTWQQRIQNGAYIPVFYRVNSSWKKDTATQFPIKNGGTRAQYNLNTSGTWSATTIDNSKYGVMFLVATNNLNEPILAIMGQSQYTDQGSAEASTWEQLDLTGFPIVEFRPLYKIVFQTATSYVNSPKTRFVNLLDLRQIISTGAGGSATAVSDHGSLTGLQDDDHTQYLLADGTRTATSLTVSNTTTTSRLFVKGIEIDAATPSDTNVLKYSASLNKYIPGVASTVAALDDLTDVVITSATPNQILKFDGTNWVNAAAPSGVAGSTYFATIGNGSDTTFTITHGLSTRDIVVSFTETASPYSSFSTTWEATTLNAITVYFETAPSANAVRVSVYAAVTGTALTTNLDSLSDVSFGTLANGDFLRYNGSYWINDPVNLSTDTIGNYVASLVAGTGITITNNSGEGTTPTIAVTGSTYQPLDADLTSIAGLVGTSGFLTKTAADTWSLDTSTYLTTSSASSTYLTISNASTTYQPKDADLTAIAALSGTSGLLKKTAADTWTLDTNTYLTSLALNQLTNVNAGSPSNDQVLAYDTASSKWINKTFSATVALLDSIGDVVAPSPAIGEFLKWNGTSWVNSNEVRDNSIRYLMDVN